MIRLLDGWHCLEDLRGTRELSRREYRRAKKQVDSFSIGRRTLVRREDLDRWIAGQSSPRTNDSLAEMLALNGLTSR